MRIIHITDYSFGSWSGISDVLFNLVQKQRELGHTVEIVNQNNNEINLFIKDILLLSFKSNRDFSNFIEQFNPTVVIFHSFYKIRYIKYYKILCKLNIPFLIQPHGAFSKFNQKKSAIRKKVANALLYKRFVAKSSGILYLNIDEEKSSVFNCLNDSSILPNGVNVPEHYEIETFNNPLKIIYLSRIDIHHKGIDMLLEALKIGETELNDMNFKLTFYGSGKANDIKYLKEKVKTINLKIDIEGAVYDSAKIKILRNADILVLTSRYEGMPITILEALSFGIPCLITPETNFSDLIIKNNSGWITSSNASDISKILILAIKEYTQNKIQLRKNSRNAITGNYEWSVIAEKSIRVYQKLITNKQNWG